MAVTREQMDSYNRTLNEWRKGEDSQELKEGAEKYSAAVNRELARKLRFGNVSAEPYYGAVCLQCGKGYYPLNVGAARVCPACLDKYRKSCVDKEVVSRIFYRLLNDPVGATKEEKKVGEKMFTVKEGTFKITPHLSNYTRNDAPVMVIRFDGDSVGGFIEVFPLLSLTVHPPDKVTKSKARIALIMGGHNVVVEEGDYLVIEDGKVYVLDEETFEARYQAVAPLK